MKHPLSVSRRLERGFTWIGLLGGITLIVFVSLDVDVLIGKRSPQAAWESDWLEIAKYVVLPLLVLMIPMFVATRWVIRTALARLDVAAAHMDLVAGTKRGFRLQLDDLPVEAWPFARAVNNLLQRLDETAERREAFAAEAAHELKTPLAILALELDRLELPDATRLKKDVMAMNRLVDQMMLMAQLEAYLAAPVLRDLVSLEDVVTDVVMRFAPIAAAQDKRLELEIERPAMIVGIKETLAAAVGNLVENGLRVTPGQGAVIVSAGPGARIGVRDGGPGLSGTELTRLSQRFARAGHASAGGAGLGLAIVVRTLEIHGGKMASDPQRREIYLTFPEAGNAAG